MMKSDLGGTPLAEGCSVAQQCAQLGRILGLDHPVAQPVLTAAVENPTYATNLLVCRGNPELLAVLLSKPPVRRNGAEMSSTELMRKGVEALWRWGRAGFSVVDDAVLQRRLAACETCPNLASPPEGKKLLYVLAGGMGGRQPVCKLCGCVVTRKARLSSESCPDSHPESSGLSRWSEPMTQDSLPTETSVHSPSTAITHIQGDTHGLRSDHL